MGFKFRPLRSEEQLNVKRCVGVHCVRALLRTLWSSECGGRLWSPDAPWLPPQVSLSPLPFSLHVIDGLIALGLSPPLNR